MGMRVHPENPSAGDTDQPRCLTENTNDWRQTVICNLYPLISRLSNVRLGNLETILHQREIMAKWDNLNIN